MTDEPQIEIYGRKLTPAQAMAVRVACTSYHEQMDDPDALGVDGHGRRMVGAYRDRLSEVLRLMLP